MTEDEQAFKTMFERAANLSLDEKPKTQKRNVKPIEVPENPMEMSEEDVHALFERNIEMPIVEEGSFENMTSVLSARITI